jgi:hypothetical protein
MEMKKLILIMLAVPLLVFLLAGPAWAQVDGQDGSITRFGEDVEVEEGETVGGSVTVFGGDVLIAGTVDGSVAVIGGDAKLESTAVVNGSLSAVGGRIEREAGSRVTGSVTSGSQFFPGGRSFVNPSTWFGFSLLASFLMLIGTLALGAMVVALIPDHTEKIAMFIAREPWQSIGWGFLLALLVIPAIILLAVTIIGIPLIPILAIFAAVAYIYGYIAASLLIGKRIFEVSKAVGASLIVETLVGLLVVGLLRFIPFVGGLIGLVIGLLGFGAVMITKFGTGRPWFKRRQPVVA